MPHVTLPDGSSLEIRKGETPEQAYEAARTTHPGLSEPTPPGCQHLVVRPNESNYVLLNDGGCLAYPVSQTAAWATAVAARVNTGAVATAEERPLDRGKAFQQAAMQAGFGLALGYVGFVVLAWGVWNRRDRTTPARIARWWAALALGATLLSYAGGAVLEPTQGNVARVIVLSIAYPAMAWLLGWSYARFRGVGRLGATRPTPGKTTRCAEDTSAEAPSPELLALQVAATGDISTAGQQRGAGPITDEESWAWAYPPAAPSPKHVEPTPPSQPFDDEKAWADAASELDGPNRRMGLWAKCYAEADGDDARARAQYLRIRRQQFEQEAGL